MILQSMLVELDNNDFRNLKSTLSLEKENKQEYQSIIKRFVYRSKTIETRLFKK